MADGSGNSVSGGMDIGRERLQSRNKYTYLGEDSQTRPLEDLGNRTYELFNQGNAQSNLLFGGPGYGGSFQKRTPGPPPGGGGAPPGPGGGPPPTGGPVTPGPQPPGGPTPKPGGDPNFPNNPTTPPPTTPPPTGGPKLGGGGAPATPKRPTKDTRLNWNQGPVNAAAMPDQVYANYEKALAAGDQGMAARLAGPYTGAQAWTGAYNKAFTDAYRAKYGKDPVDTGNWSGAGLDNVTPQQAAQAMLAEVDNYGGDTTAAFTTSHSNPQAALESYAGALAKNGGTFDPNMIASGKWNEYQDARAAATRAGKPAPVFPGSGAPAATGDTRQGGTLGALAAALGGMTPTGGRDLVEGGGDFGGTPPPPGNALPYGEPEVLTNEATAEPDFLATLEQQSGANDGTSKSSNAATARPKDSPDGEPVWPEDKPPRAAGGGGEDPTAYYGSAPPATQWAAGMDPYYGKWDPDKGRYKLQPGVEPWKDPGGIHTKDYNPYDPTWKYYTQQEGNTYMPLNPKIRNEEDTARLSPITPQGSNINDAWSTSPDWRPEAPTGGLYGGFSDLTGQGPQTAGEAMQEGFSKGAASGAIGGMYDQNVRNYVDEYGNIIANPMTADERTAKDFIYQLAGNTSEPEDAQLEGYKAMYAAPGYSEMAKRAIGQEGMLGARAASAANASQIQNMARRTNNPMAAYGALGAIGQGEADAYGKMARQNAIGFENEAIRQKEAALQGLGQNAGISNQRQLGAGALGNTFLEGIRQNKLAALAGKGAAMNAAYDRQGQGINLLGKSNQQLLDRRLSGYAGLKDLYGAQQQSNKSLLDQLAGLYGTRREDYTQLGKTTGQGGFNV